MAKLLKWKVADVPTGRYRSFERRAWPTAHYADTDKPAAMLSCDDDYCSALAKSGNHRPISVFLADWSNPSSGHGAFVWRKFKNTASTLQEAKDFLERFVRDNPKCKVANTKGSEK